jgi:hypothetical protein
MLEWAMTDEAARRAATMTFLNMIREKKKIWDGSAWAM